MSENVEGVDIQFGEVTPHESGGERGHPPGIQEQPKKPSLKDRVLNNPAYIGNIATVVLVVLISFGMDIDRAVSVVDLVLYLATVFGLGSASGLAARALVEPLRKKLG